MLHGLINVYGTGTQADDNGYVAYSSGGTTYLAVLDPDATVARTVTPPEGASFEGPVFFGPDGAAYQLILRNAEGQFSGSQILVVSTDTYTSIVPAGPFFTSPLVQFGPDGTGYLNEGWNVLGFNTAGETVVTLNASAGLVGGGLVFAPDGTAYATFVDPDGASVYALTPSGATDVLQLDYSPEVIFPVVVGPDGTAYLTTSDRDGSDTIVTAITPPAVP